MLLRQHSEAEGINNLEAFYMAPSDTLNWYNEETWIARLQGILWNTESPKRISEIYWDNLFLVGCLDVSKWDALSFLDCRMNHFTRMVVGENPALELVNCTLNRLLFSSIPVREGMLVEYSPQNRAYGEEVDYRDGIDLRSEYNFGGHITTFTWYDATYCSLVLIPVLTTTDGHFTLDENYAGRKLLCYMSNAAFPPYAPDEGSLTYDVVVTDKMVGLENKPYPKLNVYPNPTTGELKIENGKWKTGTKAGLFNLMGQKVFETTETEFSIGHLPAGVYLLKTNGQTAKIVKH